MTWEKVILGDLIDLQNGYAFKSSEYSHDGFFLMRITNVQDGFISKNNPKFVSIGIDSKLKKFVLDEGDILMSLTGDVGRVGEVKKHHLPAVLNQRVARLKIKQNSKISKQYLFKLLNSEQFRIQIENCGHGAAQLNVSTKDILSLQFFIPSLGTQQKIVNKLDAIICQIDRAMLAVEANAKNTKDLFQSFLKEIFEKNTDTVREKRFDEICTLQRGFDLPSKDRKHGQYKLLSANGVTDYINEWKVKGPGVATGRSGTIGKVHYVDSNFWALNTSLYVKDFFGNEVKYLYYFLTYFRLERFVSGAGVPTLNRNILSPIHISFESDVEKQKESVKKLDEISFRTELMKEIYFKKIKELQALKQSILEQAFNGELVKD